MLIMTQVEHQQTKELIIEGAVLVSRFWGQSLASGSWAVILHLHSPPVGLIFRCKADWIKDKFFICHLLRYEYSYTGIVFADAILHLGATGRFSQRAEPLELGVKDFAQGPTDM